MSSEKPKKLGYEAQKAILRGFDVDLRRHLSQICPDIRSAHKGAPYKFDKVRLELWSFQFDNLKWNYKCCHECNKDRVNYRRPWQEPEDNINFKICLHSGNELVYQTSTEMKKEEFFEKLLKKYMKPGTIIRKLSLDHGIASLLNFGPVNVEELKTDPYDDDLKKMLSVIDKEFVLKILKIGVNKSSLDILDEPVVRNAECLHLLHERQTSDEYAEKIMNLRNKTLILFWYSKEQIYELGKRWISTKREVGTKFMQGGEKEFVFKVIRYFKSKFPESYLSHVISFEDSLNVNSCSIPINEDVVLVVYHGGPLTKNGEDYDWSFRMEIMKKEDVRPAIVHS